MEEEKEGQGRMNTAGWIFLVCSWGGVTALVVFCFYNVFSKR